MKNTDLIRTVLICAAALFLVNAASALEIQSPGFEYTGDDSFDILVENKTGYDNYTYTVDTENETIVGNESFGTQENGLLNATADISDVTTGEKVYLTVKARNGSEEVNTTNFTVDRKLNYTLESPEKNLNTSEILEIDVKDSDVSEIKLNYSIGDSIFEQGSDLSKSFNLSSQGFDTGNYTLNLNLSDEGGNTERRSIKVVYDNLTPSYTGDIPQYVNESIKLEESFSNITSGLRNSSYRIRSNGEVVGNLEGLEFGEKYDSLDDSLTSGTKYDIEVQAEDYAGNSLDLSKESTADFEEPSVTNSSPVNTSLNVSGEKLFSLGFSDDVSSVSEETYMRIPGVQGKTFTGNSNPDLLNNFVAGSDVDQVLFDVQGLSGYYESNNVDDGVYDFVLGVVDNAGNVNRKEFELSISNNPPNISSVEYEGVDLENGSTVSDGSISVDVDSEGVGLSSLTYSWDSQEVKNIEGGEFEVNVSDDTYELEITAEDGVGNTDTRSISDVLVETGAPSVDLTRESSEGWRSSHNISVVCSDDASGVDGSAVFLNDDEVEDWKDGDENFFDISEHGQNEFEFRCRDNAGNVGGESLVLKIDSESPDVSEFTPEADAEGVSTSRTFEAELFENSILSGLDVSSSDIDVSDGQAGELEEDDGVISVELSDMPFESEITVNGTLVDQVGNEAEFETSFETEEEPAEWITIADSIEASEEMALGVMRREVGEDVGDLSIRIEDSDSIRRFELKRSEGGEASVTIVEEDDVPEEFNAPEGAVYRYAGVDMEGIESGEVISSNITFEVNSSWAESNGGQGSLSIIRNQGDGWEDLNGSVENRDGSIFVSAEIDEFSWFAVRSDDTSSGGLLPEVSFPSISLAFGLADLMTAGLIGVISVLVLYLLELLGYIKPPHSVVEKVEKLT